MTKRQFVDSKGNTWEWDETEEVRKAVARLHDTIRELEKKNAENGGDYGVGK
jgi:ubiquinone biosynthesis protein UbiJ